MTISQNHTILRRKNINPLPISILQSTFNSMTASFFLSSSNFQYVSTQFPEFSPSQSFSSTTKTLIFKIPKPLNSISSNAASFFLKDQSFSSNYTKNNSNTSDEDEISEDYDDEERKIIREDSNSGKNLIKMPTAPWMKSPIFLPSDEVLDLSKPNLRKKKTSIVKSNKDYKSLTEKISGRMGKKVVKKIVQRIERLQLGNNLVDTQKNWDDTQKVMGVFRSGFLSDDEMESKFRRRMPWEKEEKLVFRRMKKEKVMTSADLILDQELLKRLRKEASKMRKWVKVKKAGVTQTIVDEILSIWANNELVMIKFDLPLCRNMDRAREIVEIKTGGLVVWSKKDSLVVYRGCDYQPTRWRQKTYVGSVGVRQTPSFTTDDGLDINITDRSLYEREGDRLLDGLGPRYVDWWYPKPLPVDGDLLPEVVPGFRPPIRRCPPRVRTQLTDHELTYLRNFARPLPVHFVLGRNSKLQGLAVVILKLWEKSVIAKIAVKWGVPNTNNELMASELKRLTGGVLLLRNKFFIVLYRGKDFLPRNAADVVVEREMELQQWQLHEEDARLRAAETLDFKDETAAKSIVGTYSDFQHIQTICKNVQIRNAVEVKLEAERERLEKELRKNENKLAILKVKIEKAENKLWKLDSAWKPSEPKGDQELITEEERLCFRTMGLKLDKVLELGRRGVFDGVIEGIHQHWKHRELVKVISMQRTYVQVVHTAKILETESGGILVSIEKLKKGHGIIIYRGKNYKRPVYCGENLLDKKKALERSLEMQRLGSLKFFAYLRDKEIADLKLKLADLEKRRSKNC